LDFWALSFSRPARASKQPPHGPWGYLRIERFHGARLWRAQCEASPARLGKEHETPRRFVARAINPLTAQPLISLSPLTLLSFFLSLSSPKPPDDFSSTADCTDGGGPAALPLPRIVVAKAMPRIEGGHINRRRSHQLPPARCR
jgi:hypothetical protein